MSDDVLRFTPPAGWTSSDTVDPDGHKTIAIKGPGTCSALLDLWPGLPPTPGGPMATASKRDVVVDGVTFELVHTSMYQGSTAEVDVLFANDGHAYARLAFRGCSSSEITGALRGVTLSAKTKSKKR